MTKQETKIGSRIREARIECGLSQTELAKEIGSTPATISMWETYKRVPKARLLTRLADALDVTTDWILGRG